MEKIIRITSALFILLATTTVIASDSYQTTPDDIIITPGVYKTAWKIPARMREYILRMGSLTMQVYKRAPFKLKNPHRFTSRRPVYGTISKWKTPSFNSIPFVIDESKGAGKGYDLIYIDANRDGNFSDKYKLDWKFSASTKFETRVKVPMKLVFPNSDNPNLIEIGITLENGTVGDVSFYGFWEGEVKTNKGMIKFALTDADADGRYGHPWQDKCESDRVYFFWTSKDPAGDVVDGSRDSFYFVPGECVGDRLYTLKADPSGKSLEVQPYTGPTGEVEFLPWTVKGKEYKSSGIVIASHSCSYRAIKNGSTVVVPVGTYKLITIFSDYRDKKTGMWSLWSSGTKSYKVEQGQTVKIRTGGQPILYIKPIELVRGKRQNISLYLRTDQGYNVYTADRCSSDYSSGIYRILPGIVVKNSNGKVVLTGKVILDLYCSQTSMYSTVCAPPNLKPGSYTIESSIDMGPFGGIVKATRKIIVR